MAAKDLYEKDFYKVLGVDKKAAADEIKKRYRALARDLHPDKTKGDVAKEEEFKAVSEAYEILSDPKKMEKNTANYIIGMLLLIREELHQKVGMFQVNQNGWFY